MHYITFPWEQTGWLLRKLSLSGSAGNAAAWVLFLAAGALPLTAAFFLRKRRRAVRADLLLIPLSAALYAGLWFFVNPTYIDRCLSPVPGGGMAKYALAGVIDSLLLTWLLLRLVLSGGTLSRDRLLSGLRVLLVLYIALPAAAVLWRSGTEFAGAYPALREGNTGSGPFPVTISSIFLALQMIVGMLPDLCELALLFLLFCFLRSYEKDAYGEETSLWIRRLGGLSGRLLILILVTTTGFNVLQLLCSKLILNSVFRVIFPLSRLLIVLGIRMFSFLYLDGKQMKEDNDMFI